MTEEWRAPLEELDPGRRDPRYWQGFQERVMRSASLELERRRRRLEVATVSDVVFSWGRTLVPAAAVAAALALLLISPREPVAVAAAGVDPGAVDGVFQEWLGEPVSPILGLQAAPDPILVRVAAEGH